MKFIIKKNSYFIIAIIFIINICLIKGFSQNIHQKYDKQILIIASINNNYFNTIKDTSFQIDSCIKLQIDSIQISKTKKIKKANGIKINNTFEYKNNWFKYSQVINNKNINLNNYYIKSFFTASTFTNCISVHINNGSCFDDRTKEILKDYIKEFYLKKYLIDEKIFICGIKVVSENGQSFYVNDIMIEIKK